MRTLAAAGLAAAACLSLALASCRSAPVAEPPPPPLRIVERSLPRGLDPALAAAGPERRLAGACLEGLTTLAADGSPAPGLAYFWQRSADGLAWTFSLRPARWSDGRALTAGQFVDSWLRLLDPAEGAGQSWRIERLVAGAAAYARARRDGLSAERCAELFRGIELRALDDATLWFRTPGPLSAVPVALAQPALAPWRAAAAGGQPPTIGPYRIAAWGAVVVLAADPAYWDAGHVGAERIELSAAVDRVAAFRSGAADWAPELDAAELGRSAGLAPLWEGGTTVNYWLFDCRHPALADYRLRRAIAALADPAALTALAGPLAEPTADPAGLSDATGAGDSFAAGLEWLRLSGHAGGRGLPTLRLLTGDGAVDRAQAEAAKRSLAAAGVKLRIISLPRAAYLVQRRLGNFELARGGWRADDADPAEGLAAFASGAAANDGGWRSAAFDGLLARADWLPLGPERDFALARAAALAAERAPAVAISRSRSADLVDVAAWSGWVPNRGGEHRLKWMKRLARPPAKPR